LSFALDPIKLSKMLCGPTALSRPRLDADGHVKDTAGITPITHRTPFCLEGSTNIPAHPDITDEHLESLQHYIRQRARKTLPENEAMMQVILKQSS